MVDDEYNDRLGHALKWCRKRNIKNRLNLFDRGDKKKLININLLGRKDATHSLSCSHVLCRSSRVDYSMDCIILKEMPDRRLKVLVFGERNKKGYDDKKRIRYVDKDRVRIKRNLNK